MTFTSDEKKVAYTDKQIYEKKNKKLDVGVSEEGISFNENNPFAQNDYHIIINTYEKEASNYAEEDHALAYHYKDVYSTRNFSERVQKQLDYYPGMHQTSHAPKEDPAYEEATKMSRERLNYWDNAMDNPDAFMSGLRTRQQDFDYTEIFGSDTNAQTRAEHIGKLITECVPCFGRLLDPDGLLPDGDLLEVHLVNVKLRTDLLDKLKELLKDPGYYLDICELLNLFSNLCPQDLLAMLALFSQYLAKLNLDVKFNIDFILQLVGPILSPFLDALTQWLDKWIQMIIEPLICVVDHVNETIAIAQSAKIPLSEASATVDFDVRSASPFQDNSTQSLSLGAVGGEGAWAKGAMDSFNTPQEERYNPQPPEWPEEEIEMSSTEMTEAWAPSFSEAEREEQNKKWQQLKEKQRKKERTIPPPERYPRRDGTRWSKDNTPNSEKPLFSFDEQYHPPEKQEAGSGPKEGTAYLDASPLVSSIVQVRNILVAGIEYVKDWFTYATQMVYDLLGTDYGWMSKKTDNTILKSRLIELIYIIKAIIEAISKNGLRCGKNTNFDEGQLKYILEDAMGKFTSTEFKVLDDGSIEVRLPGQKVKPTTDDTQNLSNEAAAQAEQSQAAKPNDQGIDAGQDFGTIDDQAKIKEVKEKSVASGIVIKSCLKDVTQDELKKARDWIADFERRLNS